MLNANMIKAYSFLFFPAEKIAIFDDFTEKYAIQKVR
jgi:hypothetical protein